MHGWADLRKICVACACVAGLLSLPSGARSEIRPTLGFSGVTGVIEVPSGESQSDGALSFTASNFGPITRVTLTFQITPRLSGSFRYSANREWDDVIASSFPTNYDRSFDLVYQVLKEGRYVPAVAIGLRDVIGTGLQSAEYIAATKTFDDRVKVTVGLGWGRLGSYGSLGAPFGARAVVDQGVGGNVRVGQWFTGDVAPFAGIEWKVSQKLSFKAEYSSDGYDVEADLRQTFDHKSPFNFGAEYQLTKSLRLGAYYLYGSQLGLSAQFVLDPRRRPLGGLPGPGPLPVKDRPLRTADSAAWSDTWVSAPGSGPALRDALQKRLAVDGIVLESLALEAGRVEVRVLNVKLDSAPQAIGRTARAMAASLPASVEVFEIVPVVDGLPLSKVVLRRSDLEELQTAPANDQGIRDRARIVAVEGREPEGSLKGVGTYPRLELNVFPYIRTSLFDPDNPLRADLGVSLDGRYEVAPGFVLSGTLSKRVIGNLDNSRRFSNSVLPPVRSNAVLYDGRGDPAINDLTLAWYTKPAPNVYGRMTAGYLERMFGGVSAELLWKRVDRPYAFGAEINYARQRNFDQLLGFQDYDVVTGHVSGYYSFANGFLAQLDVGRYLAGDYGATLSIDREFANGWKIGAFATMTDVSYTDFGEGSFDKGIKLEIPIAWITGRPTRAAYRNTIRPILRDGGARLDVEGRLYETVREYHANRLDAEWGRFWR